MELFPSRKSLPHKMVDLFSALLYPPVNEIHLQVPHTFFNRILTGFYGLNTINNRDYPKKQITPLNHIKVLIPLTTRYLSMAWTKARGSIFTGPPFHCFTLAQSGCLCSWHFNWCVLKNFKAWDPLLREKLKIIYEKSCHKESINNNCIKKAYTCIWEFTCPDDTSVYYYKNMLLRFRSTDQGLNSIRTPESKLARVLLPKESAWIKRKPSLRSDHNMAYWASLMCEVFQWSKNFRAVLTCSAVRIRTRDRECKHFTLMRFNKLKRNWKLVFLAKHSSQIPFHHANCQYLC